MSYQRDEDEGNIGAQWKIAREVFKTKPLAQQKTNFESDVAVTTYGAGPVYLNPVDKLVANGASQFTSHEDVIKKLLGY